MRLVQGIEVVAFQCVASRPSAAQFMEPELVRPAADLVPLPPSTWVGLKSADPLDRCLAQPTSSGGSLSDAAIEQVCASQTAQRVHLLAQVVPYEANAVRRLCRRRSQRVVRYRRGPE